jgi:hypothetical protein
MPLTIDLPADVETALRADAQAQGKDAATVAAERLAERYTHLAEGHTLLSGPAHRFDLEAARARHGLPPGRTGEEIAAAAEEAVAALTPAQRAEAERLGLLG